MVTEKMWEEIEYTDEQNIKRWVEGTVNIGLGFTKWYVWVPVSLLGIGNDVTTYEDSKLYFWTHGDLTDRYILIQDKNEKAYPGGNAFVPILHDQMAEVQIDSLLIFPGIGNYEIEEQLGPYEVYTDDYEDEEATRITAYQQYITSDILQIYEDLLGNPRRKIEESK